MPALRAVVLVEGHSDRVALEVLARRLGRDLRAEGIEIVPMGGITNITTFAAHFGPPGLGLRLAGMYDAAEEPVVRAGLTAAGLHVPQAPDGLRVLGFQRCSADLEDELLRALGPDAAEAVIESAGEGRSLRLLAQMPAQRDWPRERVLRRFLGSQGGRKARYAALFVEALASDTMPAPLRDALPLRSGGVRYEQ